MTRVRSLLVVVFSLLVLHGSAFGQAPALSIVNTGPEGPLASLAQANEIRIVFSEPMVTLGRIPSPVTAPFVRIAPAIAGSFRWSGTTILIFTPDPKRPLPYATTYEVTVDATRDGRQRPHAGAADDLHVHDADGAAAADQLVPARRHGRTAPIVVLLRFNQPVRPQRRRRAPDRVARAARVAAAGASPPQEQARLRAPVDPAAPAAFARQGRGDAAGGRRSTGAVPLRLDDQLGSRSASRRRRPGGARNDDAGALRKAGCGRLDGRACRRRPGRPRPATAQDLHDRGRAGVLHRRLPLPPSATATPATRSSCAPRQGRRLRGGAAGRRRHRRATAGHEGCRRRAPATRLRARRQFATSRSRTPASPRSRPTAPTQSPLAGRRCEPTTGRRSATPWLGTGRQLASARRSPASATATACGRRTAGPQLPFYARNLRTSRSGRSGSMPAELMPTLLELQQRRLRAVPPPGDGTARRLARPPTASSRTAWTSARRCSARRHRPGLGRGARRRHAAARPAAPRGSEPRHARVDRPGHQPRDHRQGQPAEHARLRHPARHRRAGRRARPCRSSALDNTHVLARHHRRRRRGDGAADAAARSRRLARVRLLVTAEKDGDIAYVGSDWNEGILPWEFDTDVNLNEREPLLRGSVFTDRGVYRLGEAVQFKAILRQNAPDGRAAAARGHAGAGQRSRRAEQARRRADRAL